MKKKYVLFSIVIVVLLVTFVTCFNYFKTTNNYVEDNVNNQTKITKGISMNLEQTAGAGDYKTVTQSSWPTEGYKFNTELSRCENGSELSWDDTNKKVIVSGNMSDKCYVYFDLARFDETCDTSTLACHIAKLYTGTQGENGIYYHNSSLENGAGDNSYRYAGGDYILTEKATIAGMKSLTSSSDTETDGITNFYCDGERQYPYDFDCDTTSQTYYFTLQYDTTNTQYKTYNEALEKAITDGYLTKDNIKNFVCFGSVSVTCPEENLYRIIGVIDGKVKLMKYTYNTKEQLGEDGDFSETITLSDFGQTTYRGNSTAIDTYYWNNSTKKNTWSESLLNKTNLNTNFINNIGSTWANKIMMTTWKVGGNTYANIYNVIPATTYQNEVVNPTPGSYSTTGETEYSAKIGLMYASDYGFAASPSAWTTTLNNYYGYDDNKVAITDTNWMFIGSYDWVISRNADNSNDAFSVRDDGLVDDTPVDNDGGVFGVRVSFNLAPSVTYVSGDGTQNSPIRIN